MCVCGGGEYPGECVIPFPLYNTSMAAWCSKADPEEERS